MNTIRSVLTLVALVALGACSKTSASGGPGDDDDSEPGRGPGGQLTACQDACDKMKLFRCNSADEQARCYADCDGATESQIDLFVACAGNSVCDPACRTNIQPAPPDGEPAPGGGGGGSEGGGGDASGGPDGDVALHECQTACDRLNTFACVSPADHAACRGLCDERAASGGDLETFAGCVFTGGGDCERLGGCYETFRD